MTKSTLCWGLALLLCAAVVQAAEWTSPDGKIAFQLPSARFIQDTQAQAPMIASWTAADSTAMVGVIIVPNAAGLPLEQDGLNEGTLKAFPDAKLISSTQTELSGIPAYTIIASAGSGEEARVFAQVVTALDGQVYKLMTSSLGAPPIDAELDAIMRSLRIAAPGAVAPAVRPRVTANDVSVGFAQWAVWILLAALIVWVISNFRRKRPEGS